MSDDIEGVSVPSTSQGVARGEAQQLALLRIVVPAMILWTAEVRHAPSIAAMPAALRVAPEGLGWFVAHVPIAPGVAIAVQALCVFSALCAAAGLHARVALVLLTLSSFYLFALSQLSGAVWHDMHLIWMAALLAASPCDEAFSYDHRGEPPKTGNCPRYRLPLTFARLLLACIYFFPGLHKLHTSGLGWALSDNLRNQMWWKWAEHDVRDPVRFDRLPLLLHAGGLFVLGFELTFPLLALVRKTRPWAAFAGLAFHAMAAWVLRIPFVSLWALYVVLVEPPMLRRATRWLLSHVRHVREAGALEAPVDSVPQQPRPDGSADAQTWRVTWIVGVVLVAGAAIQGARGQMRSFPFACYPTFEWVAGTEMPDLLLEAETVEGRTVALPHARDANGYRSQRNWGQIWSLAGVTSPVDRGRLHAYVMQALRDDPARSLARGAVRVRCWRVFESVVPERRGDPPRRAALLAEIPVIL